MGGGQLENTNLLKKGICLLYTFLKDLTKMPIKKNTVLQFDGGGGISPPCQNHEGDKSPPPSPPLYETLEPFGSGLEYYFFTFFITQYLKPDVLFGKKIYKALPPTISDL